MSQWRRQQGKGVWNGDENEQKRVVGKKNPVGSKKGKKGSGKGSGKKSKKRVQREEGVPLKAFKDVSPKRIKLPYPSKIKLYLWAFIIALDY